MDEITLRNCHLVNSTIITPNDGADESRIGGLIGWTAGYNNQNDGPVDSYITVEDCSVTGCTIKGSGSIGGIIGHAGANAATYTTIKNCTVENNTLISTDNGGWRVGTVVGTANNGQCEISGITASNNTISQVGKTAPEGQTDYFGRFVPSGTGTLKIDGNQYFAEGACVDALGNYTVWTAAGLNYAIANMADGATVTLKDGTYEGLFFLNGKGATIKAENKGEATINGKLGIAASGKTVNINDIVFENSYDGSVITNHQYVDKTGTYIIGLYCGSVNVDGCEFNLSKNGAIYFYAMNSPEYCTVTDTVFNCNGYRPIMSKAYITVDGCTFNDQYKYSMQLYGNQTADGKVVFTNNTINNPGLTSGKTDLSCISISKSYPFSNVAFTASGNTGCDRYVYDYDDKNTVNLSTCTFNGDVASGVFVKAED